MKRRIALLAVAAAPSAIALIAAAFVSFASGSLSSPVPYGSTATASAPLVAAAAATADTLNSPLVAPSSTARGRTLYPFEKDKQDVRGAPDGQCVSGEATHAGHPRSRFVEDGKQCETGWRGLTVGSPGARHSEERDYERTMSEGRAGMRGHAGGTFPLEAGRFHASKGGRASHPGRERWSGVAAYPRMRA